ncbi:MAG: PRD domain-containing protein [Hungatella sp.]
MKIDKIINNNVVSVLEENGTEIVLMGRGLGFHTQKGQEIPEEKIQKIFRLDNPGTLEQFKSLLENLPLEHLQVSTEIINYAKMVLNRKINQNIYITLTDHINFSIERYHQHMMFTNPLLREVRTFYKEEYLIGEYAIALIEREIGIKLPVDEAASIALHIVNAEYNTKMRDTIDITNLIQEVLGIVRKQFQIEINETSLSYERFVTHLRFLSQRIYSKELLGNENREFTEMIAKMYPEEYACSIQIRDYIYKTYEHKVTDEEVAYLSVHIKRVRTQ